MAELLSKEPLIPPTQEELEKILYPDSVDTEKTNFKYGDREWEMKPLRWRYEKAFRKHAMPLMGVAFRPFEVAISNMSQSMVNPDMKSVVDAMIESEIAVDDYLVPALHVILLAQDKEITLAWVEENADSRHQIFTIVEAQCQLHKIMDRLGESLAERLLSVASMMGIQVDSVTLKQLWKQLTGNLSAQITKFTTIVDSASGQSTENLLETLTKNYTNKPETTKKRNVAAVLDPLLEEMDQKEPSAKPQ